MFCLFPEPSLAFSHSPGSMFLTDLPDSAPSSPLTPPDSVDPLATILSPELTPLSFLVSHNPLFYSLASHKAVVAIRQLETIIGEDPGKHTHNTCQSICSFLLVSKTLPINITIICPSPPVLVPCEVFSVPPKKLMESRDPNSLL